MTSEVLLHNLKHVAEVWFSLPNPNPEFHWSLSSFFLFFFLPCNLIRSFYPELILPIIFLILLFDQSFPVYDFQMSLYVIFQVILATGSQIYRLSDRTAALSFMHALWSFPAYENVLLSTLRTLIISFISDKRTACSKVTGNLKSGVLSRDLAGGAERRRGVCRRNSESSAEYIGKHFKDQKTMGN